MTKAWLVKNSSFEIFFGEEPVRDPSTGLWYGVSSICIPESQWPLSEDLLRLTNDDDPVEVMLAPIGKVIVNVGDDFFNTLAEKMRLLWPSGDKDSKYAWRESAPSLAKRLKTLWSVRNLGKFSIDDCLRVCRSYLSEYEHKDTKYMQIVKYFVLKQKEVVDKDGRIRYISNSRFADMLEGVKSANAAQEFEELISGSSTDNLI